MLNTKLYYFIVGVFAERTNAVLNYDQVMLFMKIRILYKQHQRQCENSCNGKGYIPRKGHFSITDKNAYIKDDYTVFDQEIDRLETKIKEYAEKMFLVKDKITVQELRVKFQHDPRGATVNLFYNLRHVESKQDVNISDILYGY
jgi:hypothetical protein